MKRLLSVMFLPIARFVAWTANAVVQRLERAAPEPSPRVVEGRIEVDPETGLPRRDAAPPGRTERLLDRQSTSFAEGPPAHWLERVRRGAPELAELSSSARVAASGPVLDPLDAAPHRERPPELVGRSSGAEGGSGQNRPTVSDQRSEPEPRSAVPADERRRRTGFVGSEGQTSSPRDPRALGSELRFAKRRRARWLDRILGRRGREPGPPDRPSADRPPRGLSDRDIRSDPDRATVRPAEASGPERDSRPASATPTTPPVIHFRQTPRRDSEPGSIVESAPRNDLRTVGPRIGVSEPAGPARRRSHMVREPREESPSEPVPYPDDPWPELPPEPTPGRRGEWSGTIRELARRHRLDREHRGVGGNTPPVDRS